MAFSGREPAGRECKSGIFGGVRAGESSPWSSQGKSSLTRLDVLSRMISGG